MADLRDRLKAADRIPAPDLWNEILRRADQGASSIAGATGASHRSWWTRALVAAAALMVAALGLFFVVRTFVAPPGPGVATDLPSDRGLAFLVPHVGSSSFDLMVIRGTHPGIQERLLARGLTSDASPAWSPGGTQIAFVTPGSAGRTTIVVESAQGGAKRTLTDCCQDADPAWSPDGSKIAFVRGTGAKTAIMEVVLAGGGTRQLCAPGVCGAGIAQLAWSPDGALIAFSHANLIEGDVSHPLGGIDLIASDGTAYRHLTTCDKSCTIDVAPSWSPDGTLVLYNHGAGLGHGQKFETIRLADKHVHQIANCSSPHCPIGAMPVWSPDGTSIAYGEIRAPQTRRLSIKIVRIGDGSVVVVPTCVGHTCLQPYQVAWSPGGSSLVFVQVDRTEGVVVSGGLYVVGASQDARPERLVDAKDICCASWQPAITDSTP